MVTASPDYLDLELEVAGTAGAYRVAVVSSPAGEARGQLGLPDEMKLSGQLKDLQIALLSARGTSRRILSDREATVQRFGSDLLSALLPDDVRTCYDVSLHSAKRQGKRLRVRLRIQPPELAALPWEFLYDERLGEYVCLSRNVSLVRYLEQSMGVEPLAMAPPLRILAVAVSPSDLDPLDLERERQRLDAAAGELKAEGRLEVDWLPGGTWRDLQEAMLGGPWHVFHFIGHGAFDANTEEGLIALVDESGRSHRLSATKLGRLLAGHGPLRLAVLNSCEGARSDRSDLFSSTAATLVRRGIPAVLAMQYEISDEAAIEFSRTFYHVLARGLPVDAAVGEARIAISMAVERTVEWGTPVLFMRSPDGRLFDISGAPVAPAPPVPPTPIPTTPPVAPTPVATAPALAPTAPPTAPKVPIRVDPPAERSAGPSATAPAPPAVARPVRAPSIQFAFERALKGHRGFGDLLGGGVPAVNAVAFSADGQLLLSGGSDRTVRLWRAGDGNLLHVLRDLAGELTAVAFSPRGDSFAAGCVPARAAAPLRIWRMSDAVLLREEAIGHSVHSLAYSPDGAHLAYGLNNRTVYVMRIADAAYVASFEAHTAECLAFSPDSQTLASASTFDSSIRLWRMSDHGQALSLPARGVREIAFAPDGKSLAWAGAGGQIVVYSLPGGNVVRQLPATPTLMVGMNTVAYTADGYLLVAASSDLRVHAWRAGDGLEIGHITLAKMWMGGVRALALAPRDGRMAIGGGGPVLQLWRYALPAA